MNPRPLPLFLLLWAVASSSAQDADGPTPQVVREVDGQFVMEPIGAGQKGPTSAALPADVPPYYLSRVQLDGQVVGDRAELTAEVDIHVTEGDGWQRVRLEMPEARIASTDYVRENPEMAQAPAPVVGSARGAGHVWRLKGLGRHRLILTLQVPLAPAPGGGQQLELTLPALPRLFQANLRLTIPEDPLDVRVGGEATARERVVSGRTVVEVDLPTPRLQVAWSRLRSDAAGVIAAVRTDATLRVSAGGSRLELFARQSVRATSGVLDEIRVSLPSGFELDSVEGPRVTGFKIVDDETSSGAGLTAVVGLEREGEESTVELTLSRPFDPDALEQRVILDGLAVEGATAHTGRVDTELPETHSLLIEADTLQSVRRETSSRLNIVRQPVFAAVTLLRQRPFFVVGPSAVLDLTPDRLRMTVAYDIEVESGLLEEIPLVWSPPDAAEWTSLRIDSGSATSSPPSDGAASRPVSGALLRRGSAWAFRPTTPQGGAFRFAVQSDRAVVSESVIPLTLPLVSNEQSRTPRIYTRAADSVEVELRPVGETALRPLPAGSVLPVATEGTRVVEGVESLTEDPLLELAPTIQQLRVSTRVIADVEPRPADPDGTGGTAAVRTEVAYDVEYGRLSEVLLRLPAELNLSGIPAGRRAEALQVVVDGQPVRLRAVSELSDQIVRVTLPEPSSSFTISAGPFSVPASPDADSEDDAERPETDPPPAYRLDIPIFGVAGVDAESVPTTESVQIRVAGRGGYGLDLEGGPWVRLPLSVNGASVWSLDLAAVDDVEATFPKTTLVVRPSVEDADDRFVVSSAEIHSRVTDSGDVITAARYQLGESVDQVVLRLPRKSEAVEAVWQGRPASVERDPVAPGRVVIRPELRPAGAAVLGVSYRVPGESLKPLDSVVVEPVEFPNGVFLRDVRWSLSLPAGRHLLRSPKGLTPRFRWERAGLMWSRRPIDPSDVGYPYATTGPIGQLTVVTVSRPVLVLFGAVLAFAFAFVLSKVPGAVQLPMILFAGVVLALLSLWYLEPLQVFLQPALLGLGLAAAAVLIDGMNRRGRVAPVLTVPGESEYVTPRRFFRRRSHRNSGAATKVGVSNADVRPGRPEEPDPGSSLAATVLRESGQPI